MIRVTIESASVERLDVTIKATTDPTGDAVEFVTTADTVTSPTGTWVAGSWGTYTNGKATATTPTLGASGASLPHTEGDKVILWRRIGGSGGSVERAAHITFN